jgi:hypothetical protein
MAKLNKFLKNKNTVTILGVIACLVILYAGYTMRINAKTALVDVYYANQTIQPKTLITEEMVSKTSVPESFIRGSYYKNYSDIVGKYSNYNTLIAKGSIFYSDLLVEEENLPDAIFYDINEGERVVSFPVDMEKTYGNSIMPSNIVDVYVKLIEKNGKIVYGQFYEKLEILGVKDSSGNNVFENSEEKRTPAFVYFSLEEAKYLLFSSLQYIQEYYKEYQIEIVLVPNTVEFDAEDKTATEVTSDYLYDFTLDKIKQIDEQQDLYNELLNEIEQQKLEEELEKNEENTEE